MLPRIMTSGKSAKKLYKLLERGKRREQKVLTAEENVPLQWDRGWDYRDALDKPGRV